MSLRRIPIEQNILTMGATSTISNRIELGDTNAEIRQDVYHLDDVIQRWEQ